MEINKLNYEIYFLDYYDGNLTAEQTAELMLFLEQHADLKLEFENYEPIQLEEPKFKFDKNSLKKQIRSVEVINEDNYTDYLIEEVEGNKNDSIDQFIEANPFLKNEQELFQKTVLKSDLNIVYPNKQELKKTVVINIAVKRFIAISATAAAIVFGFFLFNAEQQQYSPRIVGNNMSLAAFAEPAPDNSTFNNKTDNVVSEPTSNNKNIVLIAQNKIIPEEQKHNYTEENEPKLIGNTNQMEKEILKQIPDQKPQINNYSNDDKLFSETFIPKLKPKQVTTNDDLTIKDYIASAFKKRVLKREVRSQDNDKTTPYDIAKAGVKTFNKIFGSHINISPKYNDNGEMVAYAVSSKKLAIERKIKK